jgi:hypothetical protein
MDVPFSSPRNRITKQQTIKRLDETKGRQKMNARTYYFRCAYCEGDTSVTFAGEDIQASTRGITKSIIRYCDHCHQVNVVVVPKSRESIPLVLGGEDDEVIAYRDSIPVMQGQKEA